MALCCHLVIVVLNVMVSWMLIRSIENRQTVLLHSISITHATEIDLDFTKKQQPRHLSMSLGVAVNIKWHLHTWIYSIYYN